MIAALGLALVAIGSLVPVPAASQRANVDGPVLRTRALRPGSPVKMFIPSGTVRLIGWNRHLIEVRGRLSGGGQLTLSGSDSDGMKLVIEGQNGESPSSSRLVIYMPRQSQLSLKTVDAIVEVTDIAGWYYTVSGRFHIEGSMRTLDVEAMSGDITLDATTPWARAKTGRGHLLVGGSPQDVDASTISGALDVATSSILRGRFTSVTGDIRYAATMQPRSLFEFSDHSGAVEFLLPRDVSARFELSSVMGEIDNYFEPLHPAAEGLHNLSVRLGTGDANVIVRTFKGAVRLRAR